MAMQLTSSELNLLIGPR